MNDEDKQAIYQELLDSIRSRTREDYPQPNLTVNEYATLEGLNQVIAYNTLEKRVRDGILKKAAHVKVGDCSCNIYWKA